ncbi:hypothetical protein VP395_05040 [Mariniflexile soesokkakense]|uniref:PH (Pleckstrin Homology) domain-containing protein n=1 Tax=Mariniflexile soesokkakense TaxID=1343160 RepID=A0ABV0A942_9FLAO
MKYQYSEDNKAKAIKRNRIVMSVQYGIGAAVMIYILINNWSTLGIEIKTPLLVGLIALPFAWIYFDRNFSAKTSGAYEIKDNYLIIEEKETIKHKISLDSIRQLKKIPNGHRIETNSGTAYILDGIENKDELLKRINKTSR